MAHGFKKAPFYLVGLLLSGHSLSQDITAVDMIDIPLEALMQMEAIVETASKSDEKLLDTAAAAFVITHEDITRLGIRSIPEALRLAPGIQVARIGSNSWAIGSRAVNSFFSQYLLVLIDGRSIYSSLFSGVSWDEQNLTLEDIEKIEVIRGPGGSVWGANAVNGVINILTKDAGLNVGVELVAGAGEGVNKSYLAGRLSRKLENGAFSISMNRTENGELDGTNFDIQDQAWDSQRISLYFDQTDDKYDLQLDATYSEVESNPLWPVISLEPPFFSSAAPDENKKHYYIQSSYARNIGENTRFLNRVSFDRTTRQSNLLDWNSQNTDIDIELLFSPLKNYSINLGFNTRFAESEYINNGDFVVTLSPPKATNERYSWFIQNKVDVSSKLQILLGARLDQDSEFDTAFQPSFRFLYKRDAKHRIWGAISQAQGAPSRIVSGDSVTELFALPGSAETNFLPILVTTAPLDDELENAELTSYEAGYRFINLSKFELDFTIFHNEYKRLLGDGGIADPQPNFSGPIPFVESRASFDSSREDTITGAELIMNWPINKHIKTQYASTYTDDPIDTDIVSSGTGNITQTSPKWQHSLRIDWEIYNNLFLSTWYKYVGELDGTPVGSRESFNINFIWSITDDIELSLIGKNLTNEGRIEYQREVARVEDFEIPSSWFAILDWKIN